MVTEICERFNLNSRVGNVALRWYEEIRSKIPTGPVMSYSLVMYSMLQAGLETGYWIDYINISCLLRLRLTNFFRYSKKVESIYGAAPVINLRSFKQLIGYVRMMGVLSDKETLQVEDIYTNIIQKCDVLPNYGISMALISFFKKADYEKQICNMVKTNYRRVMILCSKYEKIIDL